MNQEISKKDSIFFPEAEFNQKGIKVISSKDIKYLKKKALNLKKVIFWH